MKNVRLWVLLLMAFVLPLRGALASGAVCPPASQATHAVAQAGPMSGCDHGSQPDDGKRLDQHQNHDAACCAAAVMAHAAPAVQGAAITGASVFAPLLTPRVSFENEGPERPPRTR